MGVVHIPEICWGFLFVFFKGIFCSIKVTFQSAQPAIKICVGCVSTHIGNQACEGKSTFCDFYALHSFLKLVGFILDNQGYCKCKILFSFSKLNFKYCVLKNS